MIMISTDYLLDQLFSDHKELEQNHMHSRAGGVPKRALAGDHSYDLVVKLLRSVVFPDL